MVKFRFEDLIVWQRAMELSLELLDLADLLDEKKKYRFSEQLRGATMSITNNIAEGSGSDSNKEFKKFLNYSRRSAFECANIAILLNKRNFISCDVLDNIKTEIDTICKMITGFKKTLQTE